MFDDGVAETGAEVARHLGVSLARVTQVLKQLKNRDNDSSARLS
jgi:hypothetical protein